MMHATQKGSSITAQYADKATLATAIMARVAITRITRVERYGARLLSDIIFVVKFTYRITLGHEKVRIAALMNHPVITGVLEMKLNYKKYIIMSHEQEHAHCHYGVKLGFKIAKLVLSAATVAVGVFMFRNT